MMLMKVHYVILLQGEERESWKIIAALEELVPFHNQILLLTYTGIQFCLCLCLDYNIA